MVQALANAVEDPDWDDLSDRQRVDTLLNHIQSDYKRTLAPSEAIIRLDDSGEADVPVQRVLTEISSARKSVKGWKWLVILTVGAFTGGGSFALWNGTLVTDASMSGRVQPLEKRMDVVEGDVSTVKTGVGNMIVLQERDRKIEDAAADLEVYQRERDELIDDWARKPARTRGTKPTLRNELVDARKKLKDLREAPVTLAPVNFGPERTIP